MSVGTKELPVGWTGGLGPGISVAMLGGFRGLAADLLWLKTNVAWEERNVEKTATGLALTTAADPRPLAFWINGARILAYDVPVWRIETAGGFDRVSAAARKRIEEQQAAAALSRLEEARRFHPDTAAIDVEMAQIELNRRGDVAAAAKYYRQAATRHDAPAYAARLYAELLRRQGRWQEAYGWLTELYVTLPGVAPGVFSDEAIEEARADVVLARIRELEDEIGVDWERRFGRVVNH